MVEERTLLLAGFYALSYRGDYAYVSLRADLVEPNPRRRERMSVLYSNVLSYVVPIPGAGRDIDDNHAAALAYGGPRLAADLRAGVDELVRMLNYDLAAVHETGLVEELARGEPDEQHGLDV